jgi:arachidonate 15-lipoxygenase
VIPSLPQLDTPEGRRAREAQLARSREQLTYNYSYMSPLAFADKVPPSNHPAVAWRVKLFSTVFTIMRNTKAIASGSGTWGKLELQLLGLGLKVLFAEGNRQAVQNEVLTTVLQGSLSGRPRDFEQIKALFVKIERPPLTDESQSDAFFARMRLAGPNPMVIRRISRLPENFPVDDEIFKGSMGPGDSLAAAGAEHRLYLADYSGLDGKQAGTSPGGQKFLAAPLALFAVPAQGSADRSLRPVAIQCGQTPGPDNPVLRPSDGLAWDVAKAFVSMADGNYHQAISHLGQTHLVLEPIVVAAVRQLSQVHPLSILLTPHFEGTLNINDGAQSTLMAPGGGVDFVMGGTIQVSTEIAVSAAQAYRFNESIPTAALAERGVDDATALPGFPYRDDALLVWKSVRKWVDAYLRLYYKSDQDVAADTELQAWIAEIVSPSGGGMKHIGEDGRIRTLDYLIGAVAHMIFLAGPQHAAVNFPQYPIMSFTPNLPLALYQPPPKGRSASSANGVLDWLPPLDMMQLQMSLGYLLGSPQYTQLGIYESTDHGSLMAWAVGLMGRGYFSDPRVTTLLTAFQSDLANVEDEIRRRNLSRPAYEFLLPSRIPQSINV